MTEFYGGECPTCGAELKISASWEPADPNYGADADGNRGMYIPGYYSLEDVECMEDPTHSERYTADAFEDACASAERVLEQQTDNRHEEAGY